MKAAIFDMDGVLIDSEPLWRLAEKHLFGLLGVYLTDEMCEETTGYRTDQTVAHWYTRQPWQGKSVQAVEQELIARVKELIEAHGTAMTGAYEILEALKRRRFKLGLASSSPHVLIHSVLDKLSLTHYFEATCSAMDEKHGKPDPAVYLSTAERLGAAPRDCVVFEDSLAGIRAAKSAGMMVIAVPAASQYGDGRFGEADMRLRSLADFSPDMIG
jgi:sugar-phosphatase